MKEKPKHAPMDQFPIRDGELFVGGLALSDVAKRVGQTPFYAYDKQLITQRINELRSALPSDIHIHYAIKANPNREVVQHLASLVDGFDIASTGELEIAQRTSVSPRNISFAGPGKTDDELAKAIDAGVVINLESRNEMLRCAHLAHACGAKPRVAIRVNPDFELKSSGMTMGGGAKQFGVDAELVPDLLKELNTLDLEFRGFHIFWGSQNLNADSIIQAQTHTFELALRLSRYAQTPVHSLNIGGGFGIPYFPGEKRLEFSSIADNLQHLVSDIKSQLPDIEIHTELGRYLVGEAGIYACKVIDIKKSRGEKFLITDGGLHHHLAVTGNFGQVIRKNYPVSIITQSQTKEVEEVNVVGKLCTPLDILASKMVLPKAAVGDLVVIYQSGAYGLSASPQQFLGQPACAEIVL